jgi:hypoxanthine phosphoribosyltransferase
VLVIDDICDSGITFIEADAFGFRTASLALRYTSSFMPDFYSEKINDDRWLVFPWEKVDSKTVQDYLG